MQQYPPSHLQGDYGGGRMTLRGLMLWRGNQTQEGDLNTGGLQLTEAQRETQRQLLERMPRQPGVPRSVSGWEVCCTTPAVLVLDCRQYMLALRAKVCMCCVMGVCQELQVATVGSSAGTRTVCRSGP
jgi:hypothetical protein